MKKIPVTERLPDESMEEEDIIVWINNNPHLAYVSPRDSVMLIRHAVCFYPHEKKWIKDEYYGDVTHWMPLPND